MKRKYTFDVEWTLRQNLSAPPLGAGKIKPSDLMPASYTPLVMPKQSAWVNPWQPKMKLGPAPALTRPKVK